ncbi:MAG: prepilin peptidase [Oscillospiraceae bacterium]|nr:prepilin peptidase [Oscillospiraceae bacterium]
MDFITVYFLVISALLGACAGSFLNCFAWRIVHGESVMKGRSHCDECGHVLGVRDLIPIVSYLASGGKCRYCGAKLSKRHLGAEIVSALVFLSIAWKYGISLETLEFWLLGSALLACSFADLEAYLVPDRFIVFAIIVRAVFIAVSPEPLEALKTSLIGGFSVAAAVLLVVIVMEKVLKKDAMGGGDIKLIFVIGLYLGWERNLLCLMMSALFGVVAGMISLKKKNDEEAEAFPWGPSIACAAWVTALFGSEIISWYLQFFTTVR